MRKVTKLGLWPSYLPCGSLRTQKRLKITKNAEQIRKQSQRIHYKMQRHNNLTENYAKKKIALGVGAGRPRSGMGSEVEWGGRPAPTPRAKNRLLANFCVKSGEGGRGTGSTREVSCKKRLDTPNNRTSHSPCFLGPSLSIQYGSLISLLGGLIFQFWRNCTQKLR